nr:MAG TPA: hypothetical protein [Caudoviricetes sp.]
MGKVHGWRISKNVQQLQPKSSVKWSSNATKYLFCCVRQFWGYRMGLLLFGIGNVGLAMWYRDCIYDGLGWGCWGAIKGGRRGRLAGPGWGFI